MIFRQYSVFILISVLFSCSATVTTIKNDLTVHDIKGKVKSLSIQTYKAIEKFGQVQEGALLDVKTMTYDRRGYIIDNDELVRHNTYKYSFNEDNLPVERNEYNADSALVGKETYAYDKKGNKIMATLYGADGTLQVKTVFKYDDNGNAIEESNYDSKGAFVSKFIYKYDDTGKPVEYNGYREDGKLMNRFLYRYDETGNRAQENQILLNTDDSSFSATTIYYNYPQSDETGNWTKQIILNEDKSATTIKSREFTYY